MFIVIEGIDGAGCETQAKALYNKLTHQYPQSRTHFFKYPHYDDAVGKMIKDFLYKNKDLSPKEQFLLYSLQFIHDAPKIKQLRTNHQPSEKNFIIADRYFTSTLCYQTLEGVALDKALRFADDFKIEKPELVFYLNVRPEIAMKRKSGEKKEKNRREKDFPFIQKTYQQYAYLIKNQVWTRWVNIDGNKGIEEITKDIYNKLLSLISLKP